VFVVVALSGRARADTAARASAAGGLVEVTLGPEGTIAGRVEDELGAPIAGARVTARLERDDVAPPWEAVAGADGAFALGALPRDGQVRLGVEAEGYEAAGRRAVIARGPDDARGAPLRIVLRRTGALGGVVREGGAPVAGAAVALVGSGVWPARSVTTDADGRYRFSGVPGGVYELRATRGDAVSAPREGVTLLPGAAREDVDLSLAPGATLKGVVWDADGDRPIVGAEILVGEEALSFAPRAARSGEGGRFEVRGLRPREHGVGVRADGFVPQTGIAARPGEAPLRVALRRAATIAGIVVDSRGEPVRGAQIEVAGTLESGAPVLPTGGAEAFRASLFALQLGGPQPLRSAGELGVTAGRVPPIPLVPSLVGTTGRAAELGGYAGGGAHEDAPAEPASLGGASGPGAGAAGSGFARAFASGPDGRFRVTGVPPGRIQLVVRHVRYAASVLPPRLVTAGATLEDVQVVLDEGGWVDGRVVDARGFPMEAVRVELSSEREPYPRALLAGRDGRFEMRGVLGDVVLTAYPAGLPAVRERVTVGSGARVEVTLRLEGQLARLAGRVVDDRGFPVEGARVLVRSLRARTPVARSAESGADGTWDLDALPPPPWSVEVDHPDHALAIVPRLDRVPRELRVTLEAATEVRGEVQDASTRAGIAGARVTLVPADDGGADAEGAVPPRVGAPPPSALSGADGAFALARVPAGRHRLVVSSAGYLDGEVDVSVTVRRRRPEPVELRAIRLERAGEVTGEVVDRLGAPVPGAEVFALRAADGARVGLAPPSDPQGRFSLSRLPPGDVVLGARHPAAGETLAAYPTRVRAGETTDAGRLRLPERFDPARAQDALGEGVRVSVDVRLAARDGEIWLREVRAGSAAARAGLRVGDVLRSVDDVDVDTLDDAHRRLAGPDGTDAVLEVVRGGQPLRFVVPRERVTYSAP
jgi:protocatechuate 3,4-dioxygenase beta subunit